MEKRVRRNYPKYTAIAVLVLVICALGFLWSRKNATGLNSQIMNNPEKSEFSSSVSENKYHVDGTSEDGTPMPVYGHWRNFTTRDGLPSDKAYTVRIDGDRVLVGTH